MKQKMMNEAKQLVRKAKLEPAEKAWLKRYKFTKTDEQGYFGIIQEAGQDELKMVNAISQKVELHLVNLKASTPDEMLKYWNSCELMTDDERLDRYLKYKQKYEKKIKRIQAERSVP